MKQNCGVQGDEGGGDRFKLATILITPREATFHLYFDSFDLLTTSLAQVAQQTGKIDQWEKIY